MKTQYKSRIFISLVLCLILTLSVSCSNENEPTKQTKWTIMYYGDGDCDLEPYLLEDIQEMKDGFVNDQGINLIVLFDRGFYSYDSSTFGENFIDTRLYRITSGNVERLDGGEQFPEIKTNLYYEANMGDPNTLKKFIQFCKANYPADHYALILSNHGGGSRKKSLTDEKAQKTNVFKEICVDETDDYDALYMGEISNVLSSAESVDLLGFDACLMSSVEVAYQFRNDSSNSGFKANYMIASAPPETGYGWDYYSIFQRLQAKSGDNGEEDETLDGYESYYDPASLTAEIFGAIIVEEQRDSTVDNNTQSLTCLDLSKVKAVKEAVDSLAKELNRDNEKGDMENLRGSRNSVSLLHYFDEEYDLEWILCPFFDIYNLAKAINQSSNFSDVVINCASNAMTAVDAMVLYSFANSDFTTFEAGKSGVHIFFQDGDAIYNYEGTGYRHWAFQGWYNALDLSLDEAYGFYVNLSWCKDGATAGNDTVENWFELLDSWFDISNEDDENNLNIYQY
ncbi:MAG: clostripain [Spirochaetota bacterium]